MKKRVRVAPDRVVTFPNATRARRADAGADAPVVVRATSGDGVLEVEVDRFVRGRLRVADLVEDKPAKAVPTPAPAPAVAGSPVKES